MDGMVRGKAAGMAQEKPMADGLFPSLLGQAVIEPVDVVGDGQLGVGGFFDVKGVQVGQQGRSEGAGGVCRVLSRSAVYHLIRSVNVKIIWKNTRKTKAENKCWDAAKKNRYN